MATYHIRCFDCDRLFIDSFKESTVGYQLPIVDVKTTNTPLDDVSNVANAAPNNSDNSLQPTAQQLTTNNPQLHICTEVLDNNQVMIRIVDNGCGMTEEVKQKVFDPFFTTKPVGSGTGLGMSISYQIIEKHGGKIKCISAPLQGTELIIQIPIQIKSA